MINSFKTLFGILLTIIFIGTLAFLTNYQENSTGFIEGTLTYPSEGFPPKMQVCATNLKKNKTYCTDYLSHYSNNGTYRATYKMKVLTGKYHVYANNKEIPDWNAYYSEYVTCMEEFSYKHCTSHTPIPIKVYKNRTTSNVDPGDWYDY